MFAVLETPMYPNRWFGGPVFHGQPLSNSFSYYFRTKEEAEQFVKKMNEQN